MAEVRSSIRDLWVIISGNTVFKSDELVKAALERNSEQVLNATVYFTQKCKATYTAPKDFHPDLLSKLSGLLGLDKDRSYQLFCSYLVYEYRGTHEDLKTVLSSERTIPCILHEVWNYYYTERLFSLFCLKYILEHWQDSSHPYRDLFERFLNKVNSNDAVVKKVIQQLESLIDVPAPTRESHGPYVTNTLATQWVSYMLQEQCELLQIVLIYYKDMQPKTEDILQLLSIFQKHGFGQRHPYRRLLSEAHSAILDLISHLECLVLIESFDLAWLRACCVDGMTDHHLLKDSAKLSELDRILSSLSGQKVQGPVLLAWLLVRTWALQDTPAAPLGRTALKLDVFGHLNQLLQHPALVGNSALALRAHTIVRELLHLLLSTFEPHTLGPIEPLFALCEKLLSYQSLAEMFWDPSEETGLEPLFEEAKKVFPLNLSPLLRLMASLAKAGDSSAVKVTAYFQDLPYFTETLEHMETRAISTLPDGVTVKLLESRLPYGAGSVVLPQGTCGTILVSEGSSVVRWQAKVNGWQVCLFELAKPREMNETWLRKVFYISRLLHNLLESDPGVYDLLIHFLEAIYEILQRLRMLAYPPIDVLGECLAVVAIMAQRNPTVIWSQLVQTGLLPALSTRPKSSVELAKGYLTTESILSQAMASQERVIGRHPVCLAFLKLLAAVAETFVEEVQEDFLACLVIVLHDIFPLYHQWPYVSVSDRELIGHRCLLIFHKVITLSKTFNPQALGSCELCVYSLLHGDSGQALLRLILGGESSVTRAIEFEGSQQSDDLLMSVRLSFSLLNRLLLLGAPVASQSPLERRLLVSPTQSSAACIVTSLAHFVYLRFEPRLCTLALQLLKRIAKLYPMSLLACLGTVAESFRDQALLRLGKLTEHVRLKVAILELLTVCITNQPGVSQLFLSGGDKQDDKSLSPCLESVLKILRIKKEGVYYCPPDLHQACVEVIHAIWACHQLRAMESLKKKKDFWNLLCFPLLEKSVASEDALLGAFILRTMALELYHSKKAVDPQVKSIFEQADKEGLIKDWSKLVHTGLPQQEDLDTSEDLLNRSDIRGSLSNALTLLASWRDLCTVIAKCPHITLPASAKEAILQDIVHSLKSNEVLEKFRISILLSELYLILLNQWGSDCPSAITTWCNNSEQLFNSLASGVTALHPRLILCTVAIASSTVRVLKKKKRTESKNGFQLADVRQLVRPLCQLLKYFCRRSMDELGTTDLLSVQVCTGLVVLLRDILSVDGVATACLRTLQEFLVVAVLAELLFTSLKVRKDHQIAAVICQLFLSLASNTKFADELQGTGVTGQVSSVLASCYAEGSGKGWLQVYQLFVQLVTRLLHTLRHFFVEDALSFAVLHLDRLHSCLKQVRRNPCSVEEALVTCHLVFNLVALRSSWVCDGPNPMTVLMRGVSSATCATIAYLSRPSLLQHLVEYKKGTVTHAMLEEEQSHPKRQLSTEEVPDPSPQLLEAKTKLQELLAICLNCCQQFSPSVSEAVSDQGLDVDHWQPIVCLSFASPSLEQEDALTFGTLLAAAHLCVKTLTKTDRMQSPAGSSKPPASARSLICTERSLVLMILEVSLSISTSQAVLYRLLPNVPPREKQFLSRELSAEMGSVKMQVQRHLRRGTPASPSSSRTSLQVPPDPSSEWGLVQLFINIVDKVFK
ncbi:nucleoporin NUP188-like [Ornithodoros turicata]